MKTRWKQLLPALAAPLLAGGAGALLMGGTETYELLNTPPLSPPGWVFPVVWTLLYLSMGASSYRIWALTSHTAERRSALRLYAVQLVWNMLWPGIFFGLGLYWAGAVWLAVLIMLVALTASRFRRLDDLAWLLMLPYLLWCVFALYLNIGVAVMN